MSDRLFIANLPLRRRCFFLTERGFMRSVFADSSGDGALAAIATVIEDALECIHVHLRDGGLSNSGGESDVQETLKALAEVVIVTSPSTDDGDDGMTVKRRRRSSTAASPRTRSACWEENIETLLCYLDTTAAGGEQAPLVDAIQHMLCQIATLLQVRGEAFYKDVDAEASAKAGDSEGVGSGVGSGVFPLLNVASSGESGDLRVTWSVAATIPREVYNVFLLK